MKKYVFIVPYIGKFPDWFQLWLNSCGRNELVDWLIFTDDHTPYHYPSNVIVHYRMFDELRQLFQSKFDFKIALNKPYKFCDFRPAYGKIFSEYIHGYDFWGYCDIDVIWGNLGVWINDERIANYDGISHWGHCTLLRNTDKINSLFEERVDGTNYYQDVFSNEKHYGFDENTGLNRLFRSCGLKEYVIPFFDVKPELLSYKFEPTYISEEFFPERIQNKVVKVDKDGVNVYGIGEDDRLVKKEFAYVHFQRRRLKSSIDVLCEEYIVTPNRFLPTRELTPTVINDLIPNDVTILLKRQKKLWSSRFNYIKKTIQIRLDMFISMICK